MNTYSKQLLLKFTFSFVVIMMLPVTLIMYLLLSNVNKSEVTNVSEQLQGELNRVAGNFSLFSQNSADVANVLSTKSCFYDFKLQQDGGTYVYVMQALAESSLQSNVSDNIFFYSRTNNMFYANCNSKLQLLIK